MDIISPHDFKAKTLIGICPWKRIVPQTIQLDVEIALPTGRTSQSDKIEDALDYTLIIQRINQIPAEFQSPRVKVSVAKLGIICGVKKLGVRIERSADIASAP